MAEPSRVEADEVPPRDSAEITEAGEAVALSDLVEDIRTLESDAGQTPLIDRLKRLSEDAFKKLIGMKVPGVNEGKLTVLGHLCFKNPCPEELLKYVLRSDNVNFPEEFDNHSIRLLHLAAYCGNGPAVKVLCSVDGLELLSKSSSELTALHMAVKSGETGVIYELLKCALRQTRDVIRDLVNGKDELEMAPLHHIAWEGDETMIRSMVDSVGWGNIDVNAADRYGFTALHIASWYNHEKVLQKLLRSPDIDTSLRSESEAGLLINSQPLWDNLEAGESHLLQFSAKRRRQYERYYVDPKPFYAAEGDLWLLDRTMGLRLFAFVLRWPEPLGPGEPKKLFQYGARTPLHCAARMGESTIVSALLRKISEGPRTAQVNAVDGFDMSALHYAVLRGDTSVVEELLRDDKVRGNVRGFGELTPLNMAYHLDKHRGFAAKLVYFLKRERVYVSEEYKLIGLLLEKCPDVRTHTDSLYKDRQLFVDAANAILVGAALIASITFAGWLQPPLGYQQYYESRYLLRGSAPPDTYEAFATVKQHVSVATFWVFNSLSFFFAIWTVLIGSCVVLPMFDNTSKLEAHVNRMRILHTCTTLFLSMSVAFAIGAFTAAGFAALPSELEYQWVMIIPSGVGVFVALLTLIYYLGQVVKLIMLIIRKSQLVSRIIRRMRDIYRSAKFVKDILKVIITNRGFQSYNHIMDIIRE